VTLKGEAKTAYMREYMRKRRASVQTPKRRPPRAAEASPKEAGEIARLRAEIDGLKATIATLTAIKPHERHVESGIDGMSRQTFKLLLKLDSSSDSEVVASARALVGKLKAAGSDLRVLADALGKDWDKQKAKPAPPPSIDYAAIEAAIIRYTEGRATVQRNKLWKAVMATVPGADGPGRIPSDYMDRLLRRLGFTMSGSGLTFHRTS
jgi:hypothetical protein